MQTANPTEPIAVVAERRIGALTIWLGAVGAAFAAVQFSPQAGLGVAVGTALAWLNYHWLRQALDAVRDAAVAQRQPEAPAAEAVAAKKAKVGWKNGAKLLGRYALIAVVVYVIVAFLAVPVLSVLAGLFALGAATIVEGIYEAVRKPA